MGPSAVRVAGLEARLEALGHVVEDAGNIAVAIAEQKEQGDPRAKYLKEIAATCSFLMSHAARNVTAQAIAIDGGWTAQ